MSVFLSYFHCSLRDPFCIYSKLVSECLPRPVALHGKYFVYVFGVYFVVWMLILFEAYGLRLRKVIASFFYRKVGHKRGASYKSLFCHIRKTKPEYPRSLISIFVDRCFDNKYNTFKIGFFQ